MQLTSDIVRHVEGQVMIIAAVRRGTPPPLPAPPARDVATTAMSNC
ncbi:hypothetical protein ABI_10230 [Asticcacaulis biprosthecium C19]|uniref:Uncharacterized protein n=1 Tax=Asticcacaulis biprosthecium C19 TaxID=715226 RepID=F4QH49_9CAUL|nr:hypothetical protein [Asticcacaulis biprosthecium]EGF92586.1 hypothetical protein ABI_10230 [Asticcacaulis biprosthecium C19]